MGRNIDKTFIQSKMLNRSKGPAVHSLRAQADKHAYSERMRGILENQERLTVKQAEVTELIVKDGVIKGVKTFSQATYLCSAVILCTGTYLKARCIYGDISNETGPNGLQAANYLTDSLRKMELKFSGLRRGHLPGLTGEVLILRRWKSSSEMKESFLFHFPRIRKMYRSISRRAGSLIPVKKRMRSSVIIWTDRRCIQV